MDFLWHKVSESEKEEIKNEAKKIMDSFSDKLSKVDKKISESFVERYEMEREEILHSDNSRRITPSSARGDNKKENEFREKMLENAPNKNDDFIIGERKRW